MKAPIANLRSKKAQKANEPSLLEQLAEPLRDIVSDLKSNVAEELRKLRERDSARYLELSVKLLPLIAQLNPKPDDYSDCQDMRSIGIKLLKSVGANEFEMTEDMIAEAVQCNDSFVDRLLEIKAKAEGEGAIN